MTNSGIQAGGEDDTGRWLFIGAGNMAMAIASGGIRSGVIAAQNIAAVDPSAGPSPDLPAVFGSVSEASGWLSDSGDGVGLVLAVKPQMFKAVAESWRGLLDAGPSRLVVSILAGTTAESIAQGLGAHARVVRVMPNTPIRLGLGMSAIAPGPGATAEDLDRGARLFGSIGPTMRIAEGLMDAFTGIAGSGPAYVFYLAEAMVEAAEQLGFDRAQALLLARQTVMGSGALLGGSPETPRALRAAVTSKGGTTAAATDTLDDAGVQDAFVRAIHAARHRGAELGKRH